MGAVYGEITAFASEVTT